MSLRTNSARSRAVGPDAFPVDPRDLVVLAVAVVVALLAARELVAAQQHRRAARRGAGSPACCASGVAAWRGSRDRRSAPRRRNCSRDCANGRPVVLAVRLVVLVVVGDEIVEREAVVRGDEVDGGPRLAAALGEQVGRGGEPRREVGQLAVVAAPVGAHRVADSGRSTPPSRARSGRPDSRPGPMSHGSAISLTWLRARVLPAGIEEAAVLVEAVRLARQDGGEVEAEAVDAHVARPVAQAVHHQLQHAGVAEVDGVAGAGVVDVVARLRRQPVIGGVVDALEGQGRPELDCLRRCGCRRRRGSPRARRRAGAPPSP